MMGLFRKNLFNIFFYGGIVALLVLCAAANFWRNRDPYRAYFHQRSDHYLSTHLIDSEIQPFKCLEHRLRGMPEEPFFRAVEQLYHDKQIVIDDPFVVDLGKLREVTGRNAVLSEIQQKLSGGDASALLRQGHYSFLYSPLSFSPLSDEAEDSCEEYISAWNEGRFPIMLVLMPSSTRQGKIVQAIRHDKYMFFVPVDGTTIGHER